jgi:hypothetical protein
MPPGEHDDGNHAPTEPSAPPPDPEKPPLLDYPSPDTEDHYGETESWSEVGRAMLVVFGVMGLFFFITFGLCGVFAHGCG